MRTNVKKLIKTTKKAHYTNYARGRTAKVAYVAIHNTATLARAENNLSYFSNHKNLKKSAHLFINVDGTIHCSVDPDDTAFAVGTSGAYVHKRARNSNSISLEFVNDGKRPFSEKQIEALAKIMVAIKKDYGVPYTRTYYLRHFDITGKNCPAYYVRNPKTYVRMFNQAVAMAKEIENKPSTKTPVSYYPRYKGSSDSIVVALNSLGINSSFTNRKKIALKNGISNYSGTASQNTKMLNLLKSGKLKK